MSDNSPSNESEATNINGGTSPSASDLFPRAPIKRARAQLSCTPCRQGKLKCNREHPVCDQCSKRARHDACHYVPPPPRNKHAQNMRGRIRNLENLVVNLIKEKSQDTGVDALSGLPRVPDLRATATGKTAGDAGVEPNVESLGRLHISNAGTESYVGAGHWSSLLHEIEEVRASLDEDCWGEETQEEEWDHPSARSTVTFGIPRPMSKAMLIQELHNVGKSDVDRLLPLCNHFLHSQNMPRLVVDMLTTLPIIGFNSADPLLFIIHAPTFLEEYKQFWKDPSSTSVMWIAMLFSIMALGIIVGPRNPGMTMHSKTHGTHGPLFDSNDNMSRAVHKFQHLASSAMVLADIAKSQPYTLETLMIYGECEFLRRDDNHSKIWLMNGVVLRVAIRMGYHRDPSHFPSITPFQGEMRRRVFHVLSMMDALVSFAIGLPTVLRSLESDVRAPRNLQDTDFSPDVKELPKERPSSEVTPALYSISKSRVCVIFAEAHELAQKLVPPKHSHIMALNKRLEEARSLIPEGMRVRPMEDSLTDPPVLIMGRFNIELLYQKTRIVLHRNYLIAGQSDPRYQESRNICLEAALETLRFQNIIFHACQPGGQLNKVWWYMSSLNTYDFILAAMVLCLEMHHLQATDSQSPRKAQLLEVLENTHSIWANHPYRYRETVRGAEILNAMIKKAKAPAESEAARTEAVFDFPEKQFASAATELTPQSMPEELTPQIWGPWNPSPDIPLDVTEASSTIDWTLWDSTMMGHTHMLPQQNWTSPASNNAAMEQWMSTTTNVNAMLDGFNDFQDPLNLSNAVGYAPPPPGMDWNLQ